jgi:broad-specificity NMP kinase
MSRIVITGAPGAGKTTLLSALQALGYTIVGDTARHHSRSPQARTDKFRDTACLHGHVSNRRAFLTTAHPSETQP